MNDRPRQFFCVVFNASTALFSYSRATVFSHILAHSFNNHLQGCVTVILCCFFLSHFFQDSFFLFFFLSFPIFFLNPPKFVVVFFRRFSGFIFILSPSPPLSFSFYSISISPIHLYPPTFLLSLSLSTSFPLSISFSLWVKHQIFFVFCCCCYFSQIFYIFTKLRKKETKNTPLDYFFSLFVYKNQPFFFLPHTLSTSLLDDFILTFDLWGTFFSFFFFYFILFFLSIFSFDSDRLCFFVSFSFPCSFTVIVFK